MPWVSTRCKTKLYKDFALSNCFDSILDVFPLKHVQKLKNKNKNPVMFVKIYNHFCFAVDQI